MEQRCSRQQPALLRSFRQNRSAATPAPAFAIAAAGEVVHHAPMGFDSVYVLIWIKVAVGMSFAHEARR